MSDARQDIFTPNSGPDVAKILQVRPSCRPPSWSFPLCLASSPHVSRSSCRRARLSVSRAGVHAREVARCAVRASHSDSGSPCTLPQRFAVRAADLRINVAPAQALSRRACQ
eukprot:5103346-Pleurochrysis_carterae.AAC.10